MMEGGEKMKKVYFKVVTPNSACGAAGNSCGSIG